jgi:hypothetical protein
MVMNSIRHPATERIEPAIAGPKAGAVDVATVNKAIIWPDVVAKFRVQSCRGKN